MGRPPIGAMTPTERTPRYNERHNIGFNWRIDKVLGKGEKRADLLREAIERAGAPGAECATPKGK